MLPFDLVEILHRELARQRREPDGLLHPSGDLIGSLRHSMLRAAGAPTLRSDLVSDIRLMTGTMWHNMMHEAIERAGIPFMQEIKVTPWLPEGWSGTADWIFYDEDAGGWVLGDLKTTKGEGMRFIRSGGAKDEHMWQLSAYWHALVESGLPMVEGFAILYLPMNDTPDKEDRIEPLVQECTPLPRDLVWGVMEDRWAATKAYLDSLSALDDERWDVLERGIPAQGQPAFYLTDGLAEPMGREQKLYWSKTRSAFEVKLVPHWSTRYCPFPDELCDCSSQGVTKIGEWKWDPDADEMEYHPRDGFGDIDPAVAPTERDFALKT